MQDSVQAVSYTGAQTYHIRRFLICRCVFDWTRNRVYFTGAPESHWMTSTAYRQILFGGDRLDAQTAIPQTPCDMRHINRL